MRSSCGCSQQQHNVCFLSFFLSSTSSLTFVIVFVVLLSGSPIATLREDFIINFPFESIASQKAFRESNDAMLSLLTIGLVSVSLLCVCVCVCKERKAKDKKFSFILHLLSP
jgi:hypothetical protein